MGGFLQEHELDEQVSGDDRSMMVELYWEEREKKGKLVSELIYEFTSVGMERGLGVTLFKFNKKCCSPKSSYMSDLRGIYS